MTDVVSSEFRIETVSSTRIIRLMMILMITCWDICYLSNSYF